MFEAYGLSEVGAAAVTLMAEHESGKSLIFFKELYLSNNKCYL